MKIFQAIKFIWQKLFKKIPETKKEHYPYQKVPQYGTGKIYREQEEGCQEC